MSCAVLVAMDRRRYLCMVFELFSKCSTRLSYVLIITLNAAVPDSIHYPTSCKMAFLSTDANNCPWGFYHFEVDLDSVFRINALEALTHSLHIGNDHMILLFCPQWFFFLSPWHVKCTWISPFSGIFAFHQCHSKMFSFVSSRFFTETKYICAARQDGDNSVPSRDCMVTVPLQILTSMYWFPLHPNWQGSTMFWLD